MRRVPHPSGDDAPGVGRPISIARLRILHNRLEHFAELERRRRRSCAAVRGRTREWRCPPSLRHPNTGPPGQHAPGMCIGLLVCGLRPSRASRFFESNVPKLTSVTLSPFATVSTMTSSAAVHGRCATLSSRVGQGWSRASQSSAVQAGRRTSSAGSVTWCAGGLCCAGRLG